MKKLLFITLVIVFLGTFVASAPAQAAGGKKVYKIDFAGWGPISHGVYQGGFLCWKQDIEEASKGRIKINIFTDGVLAPPAECAEAVTSGLVDMTFFYPMHTPGRFPVTEVFELPFLGLANAGAAARTFNDVFNQVPEIQNEFKHMKVLFIYGHAGTYVLNMVKAPVKTLEDLKGKVIAGPGSRAAVLKLLGAAPAPMMFSEYYTSLSKGVADGLAFPWEGLGVLKFGEVTFYHTPFPHSCSMTVVAMNKKKWNKLPADLQKILMDVSKETSMRMSEVGYQLPNLDGLRVANSPGHETYMLPQEDPDEWARWVERVMPLQEAYVKRVSDKGLLTKERARELIVLIGKLAEEYNPMYEDWATRDLEKVYNMGKYKHWKKK